MSNKAVAVIVKRPRACFLAGLGLALFFLSGIRSATTDFGYRNWFREGDPLLERYDAFEASFGNDEAVLLLVHSPSGVFDTETARLVVDLTAELEAIDDIARVDSLATMDSIRAEGDDLRIGPYLPDRDWSDSELDDLRRAALADELAPGYLVSADARTALLVAWLRSAPGTNLDPTRALEAARHLVAERPELGDHRFFVNGGPALIEAFRVAAEHDVKTLVPLALGLMILMLAVAFRSAAGVALSFSIVIASIAMTVGAAGLLGLPFNNVTAVVPQFLIAIAIATTMHVLLAFFRLRAAGVGRSPAAQEALESNFRPTFLTAVSTALGFFSFASAAVQPIGHLGILSGIGTLMAWATTYGLAGPLLVLLPSRATASSRVGSRNWLDVRHFVARIAAYQRPIVAGSVLFCVVAGLFGLRNTVNSDPMGYFAEDVPIRQATRFAEQNLGGVHGTELLITAEGADGVDDVDLLSRMDELQSWVEGRPYVTKTVSVLDFIKPLCRAVHGGDPDQYRVPRDQALASQLMVLLPSRIGTAYMDSETGALRLSVLWTLHDANATIGAAREIEEEARKRGLSATATGKNLLYSQLNEHVVRTFVTSLLLALGSVSLLLVLAFRSVAMGTLALIPNVVPLMLGAGLLRLLGKPLDIGTVIVGSVCLGIAVDDTIHFLSAYQTRRGKGMEPSDAVTDTLRSVGPALVGTTLVLVAGFGLLVFAAFVPNQKFGMLLCFGLSAALLADLVLTPALVLGRLPESLKHPLRRAHEHTGTESLPVSSVGLGLLAGLLLFAAQARAGELSARAIAERTFERDDGKVVFRTIALASCDYETTNDGSQRCASKPRQKRFHSLMDNVGPRRQDIMVLNVLEAPAAEKGVAFLQRNHAEASQDSEQWIYLPALKRVKRIVPEASGGPKRGQLFSSELAYEDLEQWHLDDYLYTLLGEESVSGRDSWVLELRPTEARARQTSYQKLKMWIDQTSWLPLRVESFKTGDEPVKTIYNREIQDREGVWLARETIVVNHESERMSRFETVSVAVNPAFPSHWSHARALEDQSYRDPVFAELERQAR